MNIVIENERFFTNKKFLLRTIKCVYLYSYFSWSSKQFREIWIIVDEFSGNENDRLETPLSSQKWKKICTINYSSSLKYWYIIFKEGGLKFDVNVGLFSHSKNSLMAFPNGVSNCVFFLRVNEQMICIQEFSIVNWSSICEKLCTEYDICWMAFHITLNELCQIISPWWPYLEIIRPRKSIVAFAK